jgi:hypothetical protein
MDHYNQFRRHRLNPDETPIVMQLIWNKLTELSIKHNDPIYAEQLFKILYRFVHYSPGRPLYPEFNWKQVSELLHSIDFSEIETDLEEEFS